MTTTKISVDHLARIEGHGNIRVTIDRGVVQDVQMNVVEPARFFESMVKGRLYSEVPYIASRICGICSSSHTVTDILAIEDIFDVRVSSRTKALRELLLYGSYLQNHVTHLFVFAIPDFVGEPDMFPLAKTNPEFFSRALELKSLGNELCTAVGGRSIHPITAVVGGFTHEITSREYLEFARRLDDMVPFAITLADTVESFALPVMKTQGDFLAMYAPECYPVCDSRTMRFIEGGEFDSSALEDALEEYPVNHSSAFFARERVSKRPYMTGALARINCSWANLTKTAKVSAAKVGLRPPEKNILRNNVSQAVEIVDALVRCADICRKLAWGDIEGTSQPVSFEVKAGKGVGYTEAPRGALFHELELDARGRVVFGRIITPTAQNLANMESDMRILAEVLVAQGAGEDDIRRAVEMLVRAYDPCLSCSVH